MASESQAQASKDGGTQSATTVAKVVCTVENMWRPVDGFGGNDSTTDAKRLPSTVTVVTSRDDTNGSTADTAATTSGSLPPNAPLERQGSSLELSDRFDGTVGGYSFRGRGEGEGSRTPLFPIDTGDAQPSQHQDPAEGLIGGMDRQESELTTFSCHSFTAKNRSPSIASMGHEFRGSSSVNAIPLSPMSPSRAAGGGDPSANIVLQRHAIRGTAALKKPVTMIVDPAVRKRSAGKCRFRYGFGDEVNTSDVVVTGGNTIAIGVVARTDSNAQFVIGQVGSNRFPGSVAVIISRHATAIVSDGEVSLMMPPLDEGDYVEVSVSEDRFVTFRSSGRPRGIKVRMGVGAHEACCFAVSLSAEGHSVELVATQDGSASPRSELDGSILGGGTVRPAIEGMTWSVQRFDTTPDDASAPPTAAYLVENPIRMRSHRESTCDGCGKCPLCSNKWTCNECDTVLCDACYVFHVQKRHHSDQRYKGRLHNPGHSFQYTTGGCFAELSYVVKHVPPAAAHHPFSVVVAESSVVAMHAPNGLAELQDTSSGQALHGAMVDGANTMEMRHRRGGEACSVVYPAPADPVEGDPGDPPWNGLAEGDRLTVRLQSTSNTFNQLTFLYNRRIIAFDANFREVRDSDFTPLFFCHAGIVLELETPRKPRVGLLTRVTEHYRQNPKVLSQELSACGARSFPPPKLKRILSDEAGRMISIDEEKCLVTVQLGNGDVVSLPRVCVEQTDSRGYPRMAVDAPKELWRVRRHHPHWHFGNEDGQSLGVIEAVELPWVKVSWYRGTGASVEQRAASKWYAWGYERRYEVMLVPKLHDRVVRSPWCWSNGNIDHDEQGRPSSGELVEIKGDFVYVRWGHAATATKHLWGLQNRYEVLVAGRDHEHRPMISDSTPPTLGQLTPMESVPSFRRQASSDAWHESKLLEPTKMSLSDLRFPDPMEEIGAGIDGKVYKAYYGTVPHAVKKFRVRQQDLRSRYETELDIIAGLVHPNILRLAGWSYDEDKDTKTWEFTLVTPLVQPGSLAREIEKIRADSCAESPSSEQTLPLAAVTGGTLGWENFFNVAIGLTFALEYLKARGLIHADIKPGNVFIDSSFSPLLADFGFSVRVHFSSSDSTALEETNAPYSRGTPGYMAPEVFSEDKIISPATDMYSFGVLIWSLLSNQDPPPQRSAHAAKCVLDVPRDAETHDVLDILTQLVAACQHDTPRNRPTPKQARELLFRAQATLDRVTRSLAMPDTPLQSHTL